MRCNGIVLTMGAAFALSSCADPTSVRESPAVGISVSATELNLVPGEEKVVGAWLVDEKGNTVRGKPDWSSSDPTVAEIDMRDGVVTAKDIGTATMTASFGAFRATTFVTVRPLNPPNTLAISLPARAVLAGGSDSLAAEAFDAKGRITPAAVSWSSADVTVATIDASGIVVGIGAGSTTITATAGALSATVPMSVIALTSSLSFSRWTPLGQNQYVIDVLSFTASDRLTQPVARNAQFASIAAPDWSADGSLLAIEAIRAFSYDLADFWGDYNSDVYVLDGPASGPFSWRALTTDGFSKSPRWSPDGTRVAYLRQSSLFAMNNIVVLDVGTGVHSRVTRTDGWYGTPSWSPDGQRLVFSRYVENANYQFSNDEVFVVNADGSGLTNVSNHTAGDFSPSWSPDGTRIAFVSWRDGTGIKPSNAVYVMDVNGANVRRLASGRGYITGVTWSPGGQQIAFSAGGSLYVMNADGSTPARLTRPPLDSWDGGMSWRR